MSHRERGFSLAELMVGIALGLFLVAGASKFFVDYLHHSRLLLADARLNHDMRAVLDTVAREMRNAGYWDRALDGAKPAATANPYRAMTPTSTDSDSETRFDHDGSGYLGFRVDNAVLKGHLLGSWQPLTDIDSLRVTDFNVTSQAQEIPLGELCTPACAPGAAGCPSLVVRRFLIGIEAQSGADRSLVRRMEASVRVRNDEFTHPSCP